MLYFPEHPNGQLNSTIDTIDGDFDLRILVNFDGLQNKELFHELAYRKLLSTKRHYLIYGSSLQQFKDIIETVPVHVNSQIKFVEFTSTDSKIFVHLIKNPAQPYGGYFTYHLEQEFHPGHSNGQWQLTSFYPWNDEMFDWTAVTFPVSIVSLSCANTSLVSDEFLQWFGGEEDQILDGSPRHGYALFMAIKERMGFK